MLRYRPTLTSSARGLRAGMTEAEQRLWFLVRRKQLHAMQFYRQKVIGTYIVDFYAPAVKLVVEVDGEQHLTPDGLAADRERTAFLESQGLMVLRFDNRQVLLETQAVLERIFEVMKGRL